MLKSKLPLLYSLSGLLFLSCFYFGLRLAEHKSLWNDEIYSQIASVSGPSYSNLLLGRIGEGNTCPLFYSIQKIICDLWQYKTPDLWHYQNVFDRIILRLNPVFFMSASIMCIFFYFSWFYSLVTGAYSLFITFSSYMVWVYWAEARPYGLWFFFTTLQSLFFIYLLRHTELNRRAWAGLVAIHFFLSLTVIFSIAQILIVSGLVWILKERDWKKYIFLAFIPGSIALFYYLQAPQYQFWFDLTSEQLIRDCFSRDRFYILFIFVFFLSIYFLAQKTGFPKSFPDKSLLEGFSCFLLTVLMLLAAFSVLILFKMKASPLKEGFPISSRYFIYLTPIGIISTVSLSMNIFQALSRNRWIQMLVFSGMGYLIIHRFFKMLPHIGNICAPIFS